MLFRKGVNIIKLIISYFFSILSGKVIHWGLPLGISFEPINSCNLQCKECPTGIGILTRAKGRIDYELYKNTLDELASFLTTVIFYFQGEPFMNTELHKFIDYATKKNIFSITSSNGHFISSKNARQIIESGLNKLIISIDGTTQNIYEKYRINGLLEKVIDGTRTVIQTKKELNSVLPRVVFQFLVTSENEHQIEKAKLLAKRLHVDSIDFKTAQIYDFENGNSLIPLQERYSRYTKQKDGTYKVKSKLKNRCWRMWSQPVVTVSGDVVPCCFDKDAKYKMGNLNESSFKKIWNSLCYKQFRNQVFNDRKSIDICRNCTEGLFKKPLTFI